MTSTFLPSHQAVSTVTKSDKPLHRFVDTLYAWPIPSFCSPHHPPFFSLFLFPSSFASYSADAHVLLYFVSACFECRYILALLRKKKDSEQHAHKIYFGVRSLPSIYWHTFETHVCSQRSHISAVWQGKWMKITYGTVSRVHVEDREFRLSSYLTLLFSFSLLDTQTHAHKPVTRSWCKMAQKL